MDERKLAYMVCVNGAQMPAEDEAPRDGDGDHLYAWRAIAHANHLKRHNPDEVVSVVVDFARMRR